MKELMQHLLDGGKLVDENGFTIEIYGVDVRGRQSDGSALTHFVTPSSLIQYLSQHDLKPLYEDGLYEVQLNKDDDKSTHVARSKAGNWWWFVSPPHHGIVAPKPYRIIRKIEPREIDQ